MADSGIDDIKDIEILVTKGNLPLQRLLVQIPEADKGTLITDGLIIVIVYKVWLLEWLNSLVHKSW